MTSFFVLINIILTILSLWGAIGAYNGSASFNDIIGINLQDKVAWTLLSSFIGVISILIEGGKTIVQICAVIIPLCGAYIIYDHLNDTVGDIERCFEDAGLDLDKQRKCADKARSNKEHQLPTHHILPYSP